MQRRSFLMLLSSLPFLGWLRPTPAPQASTTFMFDEPITGVQENDRLVVGIIGARDNGRGMVGYAFGCELVVCKVLGSDDDSSSESIARGIQYAIDNNIPIVSRRLGS